jgi:uncharacterized protein YjbI with pentapeptide repeats
VRLWRKRWKAAADRLTSAEAKGMNDKQLLKTQQCIKCDLQDADLEGANLEGASLLDANLGSANLEGASLLDANLWGANLKGAKLDATKLKGAIRPDGTKHP